MLLPPGRTRGTSFIMPSTPSPIGPSALMHSDIIISAHSLHGLYICTGPTNSSTMPPNHRPQTLKQAKKAYRKSGATVHHLSESELAIIERRIVLQERADRMKEREARRKANIKRKEERNQRERETRARMGIKEPVKEGITHVGPSQLSLGGFLGAGEKRKREGEEEEGYDGSRVTIGPTRAESGFRKEQGGVECHNTPTQRTPWRNPLKVIPANLTALKTPSEDSAKADMLVAKVSGLTRMALPSSSQNCSQPTGRSPLSRTQQRIPPATAQRLGSKIPKEVSDKHENCQVMVMAPPPSRIPLQGPPPKPCTQPKPLRQPKGADITTQGSVKMESCEVTSMAPPPRRAVAQCRPCATKIPQKPSVTAPSIHLPGTNDECWDDFFVSGTQIARELSPPAVKAISDGPPAASLQSHASAPRPTGSKSETAYPRSRPISKLPLPARLPSQTRQAPLMTPKDDTAGLLDLISTQDLDFSGILTQAPHIVHDDTDNLLAQISSQDLDFSGELTQAAPQAPSTVSSDFDEDLTEEDLEDVALEFERECTMAKSRTTTPHSQRTNPETQEDRSKEPQRTQSSATNSKPSSSANITAILTSKNEGGSETHAYDQAAESYLDHPQLQAHPPKHPHNPQVQHPPSDSDDDRGNLDEYTFDNDISPDAHPKKDIDIVTTHGNSEKTIKTEKNIILHFPRTCSQEAKLAAEYDIFELSTQDLRELEA